MAYTNSTALVSMGLALQHYLKITHAVDEKYYYMFGAI